MKLTSLIALILAVICLMWEYVLNYWYGYHEESLSPIVWNSICLLVELFILLPTLLIIWIVSLLRRKYRFWATATLVGFLALIGLRLGHIIPSPRILIMYGMRNRIIRDYSLDDLRRLAHDVDQLAPPQNAPLGQNKVFMREDVDKTQLKQKYPFLTWGRAHSFNGPSAIAEEHGVVTVWWGGELSGHWGFGVAVNGGRAKPDPYSRILRVSNDIFFFVGT
jgi:hypothetical protein